MSILPSQHPDPDDPTQQSLVRGAGWGAVIAVVMVAIFGNWFDSFFHFLIVCVVGAVSGALLTALAWLLPDSMQQLLRKAVGEIGKGVLILIFLYYPYLAVLGSLILFVSDIVIAVFNLPLFFKDAAYLIVVVAIFLFIVDQIVYYVIGRRVKQDSDHFPVDIAAYDHDLNSRSTRMVEEWEAFKAKLRPGDEVWLWRSPLWTWKMMTGREGLMIVRNGRATRHRILIGMN